jgi:tocopherol cyclase
LAAFPIFEPHYQVLISKGTAAGSLSLRNDEVVVTSYDLTDVAVYLKNNWGGSFPSKWWWIQANTFQSSNLCVTLTGARRRLPFLKEEEEVDLVALHWNHGEFLPFPEVNWDVRWGKWTVRGSYESYDVELEGTCNGSGIPVKCPTLSGMEDMAFETFHGLLQVKLYKNGSLVLEDTCDEACLEVGGIPWTSKVWTGESAMKEPIKSVAMNVDLERKASDILQILGTFVEIPGL